MSKCYYHGKTEAVASCAGCKMPVCGMCRDEGAKGFCDQCTRKRASVSEPGHPSKTPTRHEAGFPGGAARKGAEGSPPVAATGARSPIRPGSNQRADVVYCFRHDDIRAEASCATCSRPYCPACLNTSGVCGVCIRVNKDAQARAFGLNDRGRAVMEEVAAEKAAKRLKPRDYAVVGLMVVGLLVSYKFMTPKQTKLDETKATLARARSADLTPDQLALLASLKNQKRVSLADPAPASGGAASTRGAGVAPAAGGVAAPAAADPGAPLEIRATAPADGAIVGGTASIRAAIAGSPSRVVCEIDGAVIGTSAGGSPRFAWNTRASGNGSHTVTITAFNAGGSTSSSFSLNVLNR